MVVTVLDFSTGEVNIHNYPDEIEDVETYLAEELEYNTSNCQWLCTNKLILKIHEV